MNYPQNINCFGSLRCHIFAFYYCIVIIGFKSSTIGLEERNFKNYQDKWGWISPSGEVIKHTGQDLEILCSLDLTFVQETNFSSKNLKFVRSDTLLDFQTVTIVNETTIRLYLSNGHETDYVYECVLTGNMPSSWSSHQINVSEGKRYNPVINENPHDQLILRNHEKHGTSIGSIRVIVGTKPKNALNFRCFLISWTILRCDWDWQRNYYPTSYSIQYVVLDSTNTERISAPFKCPNDDDILYHFCFWSRSTNPPYLNTYQQLSVTLTGKNAFGTIEQVFIFNPNVHVRPYPPANLFFDLITSNSFILLWYLDSMHDALDWIYEIRFGLNFDHPNNFTFDSTNVSKSGEYFFCTVSELTPITFYKLDMRMKPLLAPGFSEYWSRYSKVVSVWTKPLPATHIAETDVGLFDIIYEDIFFRHVLIRWKPMNYSLRGPFGDLHYEVEVFKVDQNGSNELAIDAKQLRLRCDYAVYEISHSSYRFFITSTNSEGRAPNPSLITVPTRNNIIQLHFSFYEIIYTSTGCAFGTPFYTEYNWQLPKQHPDVLNYTLHWWWKYKIVGSYRKILTIQDSNYIILPSNVSKHNISIDFSANHELEKINNCRYGTSISVNTKNSTTGSKSPNSVVLSVSGRRWNTTSIRKHNDRVIYKGLTFSPTKFQKWMAKLHGMED